jgi:hypothetical protein
MLMKQHRLSFLLKRTALVIAVAGFAVWAIGGARIGWTQTSVVTLQLDEITGIQFPVREAAFLPGLEVPFVASALAAGLILLSWFLRRPVAAHA